jgi:hypothetical protein
MIEIDEKVRKATGLVPADPSVVDITDAAAAAATGDEDDQPITLDE